MANIRVFYAVTASHDYQSMLNAWLENVKEDRRWHDIKWIPPQNYHITLAFLGNVTPAQLTELEGITCQCAKATQGLRLLFDRLDYFPDTVQPKVLAMIPGAAHGVPEALRALHRSLLKALLPLGFALRQGHLRPHLSVARVKATGHAVNEASLGELKPVFSVPLVADNLTLLRSEQTQNGSRYSPIFSQALGVNKQETAGD